MVRTITKGIEPQSLITHRLTRHSYYGNYVNKKDLRQALVKEQRALCCYCMGRISPQIESMKIEHWQSQAHYPDKQLDYKNLLGSCLGGERQPYCHQHCDTRKGNRSLKWNPANPLHRIEARVQYGVDGSIKADDADFNKQINDVLNLNLPRLKNSRKNFLGGFLESWRHERARIGGPVPRKRYVQQRKRLTTGDGPLQPFSQVAVWLLDKRLESKPV